jgi:hypothetical protein
VAGGPPLGMPMWEREKLIFLLHLDPKSSFSFDDKDMCPSLELELLMDLGPFDIMLLGVDPGVDMGE